MKNFVVTAAALVMVSALGVVWASCGGDSDDDATPGTSPAAVTAQATTAANATSAPTSAATTAATAAAGAQKYADLSAEDQTTVGNLCAWAADAEAGTLDPAEPFADLFGGALGDATVLANVMRAGQLGKTLEPHGKALADAAASRDPSDLKIAGRDISGACESMGWTP